MMKNSCSLAGTVDELLTWPEDLLVLVGHDGKGDPDDDDDDDDDDDTGDGDDDADGDPDDDADEPPTAEEIAEMVKKIANYEAERGRNVQKRKDAQTKAQKLQQQLDELIAKSDLDEDVKKKLDDLTTENGQLKGNLQKQAIDLAFFRANKHEWQNPKAALKLVDRSELEIEDDGTVNGLEDELDRIAREEPYLLKPKEGKGGAKKPPVKSGGTPRRTGSNDSKSQAAQEAKLRSKYPALRRR